MQEITVQQLKSRVEAGEQLNEIDVREPHEYAEYNLGAKLIPLGQVLSMQLDELDDLKNEELIIHCKSGKRSLQACLVMEQMGFSNVKNLVGGAMAWQEKFNNAKIS